jgi:predicted ATPase
MVEVTELIASAAVATPMGGGVFRDSDGEQDEQTGRKPLHFTLPTVTPGRERSFARPEAKRLEELHGAALEQHAALLLGAGRVVEAAAAMEALIAAHPHREGARALLMEALYHLGRHTEALDVYQSWRSQLAEDLGLEPSPALRRIEQQILEHTLGVDSPVVIGTRSGIDVRRPVSSFVGRDDDVAALVRLLGEVRMVTLWGPGGVGKTRLALELAAAVGDRYPDGVHLCDLAVVGRASEVTRVVASALGAHDRAFSRLEAQIISLVAGRRALIVLDNCEHVVVGAGPLAERIIQHSAQVDIVATSRERLMVDGEHLWEVKPLSVSGNDSAAVRLFLDRARATNSVFEARGPDLDTVAEVCDQLDGLPLAIELAAARVRGLSLQQLCLSLDQRFHVLTSGPNTDPRHQSLDAVLDWSYGRLGPVEQLVFDRLAVFRGAFDLDAADIVAGGDGVERDHVTPAVLRLVDCALVIEHPGRDTDRYMYLDTTRRFGLRRLESRGALTDASRRHAVWAVTLAEQAADGLKGPHEAHFADTLDRHIDDLRAAHTWLVGRDTEASLRLATALRP